MRTVPEIKTLPHSFFKKNNNKEQQQQKKIYFYLCKDDPAAPSKRADGFQFDTSQHHRDPGREGGRGSELSPATPPPRRRPRWGVLGTTAAISFCASATSSICEKQEKKKWRERIYLYFCTEETHELRHYWCSVYTQTRCRASFFGARCRFRPPGTASRIRRAELFFPSSSSFAFVRQKCVLVPFRRTHSTQSREHRKLFCDGAALQRGAGSQLFIHSIRVSSFENSFRSHFSFLPPPPHPVGLVFIFCSLGSR